MVTTTETDETLGEVGSYLFRYMLPGKEYEFYIVLPREKGSGKVIYKMTQAIDDNPLDRAFENDGRCDGWTNSFKTVIPVDADGNQLLVTDPATGAVLSREAQKLIDFGIVRADASFINGVIWDDSC